MDGWLTWLGGTIALLFASIATVLLWQDLADGAGLALWLAGMLAMCATVWHLRPLAVTGAATGSDDSVDTPLPSEKQSSRFSLVWQWEAALLLLIVAGALAVRFWDFSLFPAGIQSDEGNNGLEALKWLSGAPYTPYSEINEGQATLFTYLIAAVFSISGPSVEAMRAVPAAIGVGTVVVFYFFARDHLTPTGALAGAALMAFSRWHITFSRIVYELILTPLALIAVFYFLHRGLRDGRMRDFVFAGLAIAFGFNTYTAFRAVPIGVALLFVYWLVTQRKRMRATLAGGLVTAVSALVGLIPLIIYTAQNPAVVQWRTRRLNLLGEIDGVGSLEPLWTNLRNYLLMFHLRGDPVPINNLPGEPALNAIVAVLAGGGLVYALRHIGQPRFFLVIAWLLATLPAGILSVTLESPSSRRVIGVLPLVYFLAAIALDLLWRQSANAWGRRGRWLAGLVVVLVVLTAGYRDVAFFFTRQVRAESVKMAFSPVESAIGRYIAGQDGQAVFYLNQDFRNHSAIQLIAGNPDYTVLDTGLHLPLPRPHDQPVVYILSLGDARLRFLFEQFYSGGVWKEHATEFGVPLFHTFTVSPEQQLGATGLRASLTSPGDWESRDWENPGSASQRTPGIVLPDRLPADETGVVWSGSLRIPAFGKYTFRLDGVARGSLLIDGEEIFSPGRLTGEKELVGGFHSFVLAADRREGASPTLYWRGVGDEQPLPLSALFTFPAPPFGLTGFYYPNANWAGAPVLRQRDSIVASTDALPWPYSVVWSGEIQIDSAGPTVFGTMSDDGSFVYVDGQLAVDNGGQHGAQYREGAPLTLSAGRHAIEIFYFQDGGSHRFELFWTPPGQGRQWVPPDYLFAGGATANAP